MVDCGVVVQALVEHYAALGQPDAVERCVLQMDIASLDFNQIVKLCRQHHLLSALAYILNRGLNDFVTPAAELLLGMLSVAEPPSISDPSAGNDRVYPREAAACKLLAYLRCCFRGEAFPPGALSYCILRSRSLVENYTSKPYGVHRFADIHT